MIETPQLAIDGPALVFGGTYSNLQATRAVLAEGARRRIPAARVICTGDLVAYCGDPAATIDLVRRAGVHVVMGNCDEQLAQDAPDCGCGFPSGSTCERLSSAWFTYADTQVDREARAWLGLLPRRIDLLIGGFRLAVIHGSVSRINQFVFASTAAEIKRHEIDLADADGVIGGHCGLPFSQAIDGRLWHNAGVVGMPAHDGTPRAWFSVLTPDRDGLRIEHGALAYDHQAAAAAMARAGLPPDYREALASGIWPSCDVLPYREIRESGVAIEPGTIVWKPAPTRRRRRPHAEQLWPADTRRNDTPLDAAKFHDPRRTAKGEPRASVALRQLDTLWFNTGTRCNITCRNCYIEFEPAQRPARLYRRSRHPPLPRRDRARVPRHPRDRLHGRRAVHEPAHLRAARREPRARLSHAGPHQRDAANAAPQGEAPRPAPRLRRSTRHPRLARPFHRRPPRRGTRLWHLRADPRRPRLACPQRFQPFGRGPHHVGRGRGRRARRLCALLRRARDPDRRR